MEKSNPKKSVLAIFKMSQRVADIYDPVHRLFSFPLPQLRHTQNFRNVNKPVPAALQAPH